MSGVDPKELVQRNIPLIVLYVVALAALPAWYVVVQGGVRGDKKTKNTVEHALFQLKKKESTIKTLAGRVEKKDPADPVYNTNFKDYFDDRAKKLREQTTKLSEFVRSKDQELEKWFPHFQNLGPGQEPDFNNYKQHWESKAIPELVEDFKPIVTDPNDPEQHLVADDQPRDRNQMRFSQKRYWAQKYILKAIESGGTTGIGMTKPKEKDVEPKKIPAQLVDRIQIQTPRKRAEDKDKPAPLIETFRVTLKLRCSFRDVGQIMREVVAQPIPMQINGFEITKDAFRVEDREISLLVDGSERFFPEDHTQILLDDIDSQFKGDDKLEEYVPEPSVVLALEIDVLDFNPPEKKPAPAAPAGEEGK